MSARRRAAFALALAAAFASFGSAADDQAIAIQRIKAAFLSKFAAYVEWPTSAFAEEQSPVVIGVAGAEAMADEIARVVAGRKVGTRPMQVRRLAPGEHPDGCCQILFIGKRTSPAQASDLLAIARGSPVLTVTEAEAAHPTGSIINFLGVQDRVRFDISRGAAEQNGLQLRSQLLTVARQVRPQ